MAPDRYRYFRIEARELLDALASDLLALERPPLPPPLVPRLLRSAHTLKGAARVVKQKEIAEQTHLLEEALVPLRDSQSGLPKTRVDALLALVDDMRRRVEALEPAPATGGAAGTAPPVSARPADPTDLPTDLPTVLLRREASVEVDQVLEGLSELGTQLEALRQVAAGLAQTRQQGALLSAALTLRPDGPGTRVEHAGAQAVGLELRLHQLQRHLNQSVERMERELGQTRGVAEGLRLAPIQILHPPLERAARDAAHVAGRQVELTFESGGTRVDAGVLAALQPALIQLVRNAVAHGLEPEAERRTAGKDPTGRVWLRAQRRGGQVELCCGDDGRGVDLEAVRNAALRRGLLSPGAAPQEPEALLALLLLGGVSTSAQVTQLAGRGVGLDVVREAVDRLGGTVRVTTQAGRGTQVWLTVPVSLSSLPVLMVRAGGIAAAIPLESVRGTLRVRAADRVRGASGVMVRTEGGLVPFAVLGPLVGAAVAEAPEICSAVILSGEVGGGEVAVGVDRLLGTREGVLQSLPPLAPASAVVAGAMFDAEGNPQLVVEPSALVVAVRQAALERVPVSAPLPRLPVLVVDDSLTTRMLEQSILESAGYEVDLAASAEEGLERARARRYGIFLVDVEMPGMDGFRFVERIRQDPALAEVPAILVTSRDAPADRERGAQVGAQAYVVKAEFDQGALLKSIARLTERP